MAVVIDDARIPILSITQGTQVLVDLAMNSYHSIEHVTWFHRIGAVPPSPSTAGALASSPNCKARWRRCQCSL